MKTISAGDANRQFSSLLRDVATGQAITVLSRGKPVATIVPPDSGGIERQIAKHNLIERLQQQKPSGERNWTREELYEA